MRNYFCNVERLGQNISVDFNMEANYIAVFIGSWIFHIKWSAFAFCRFSSTRLQSAQFYLLQLNVSTGNENATGLAI